ncbi:amidase [Tabrizicola sp.]|jgi:amidase|uniref:amidase n=1 Tax=Tabrizicola sp. TaxID=2005166 RepID=UPI0025E5368A|nr:amidase [Tabrizicola sp.]MBY0351286.1 amidase [Tabrizicola sp.]
MLEWSATELSSAIRARRVAPSEVMAAWLAQVAAVNGRVNAIVSLRDPEALLAEARRLDDAAPAGWLHGIPFAVKDLVATRGVRTTWGSPIWANHLPAKDDLVAARLRGAGALIAAKTNVPEWGQGSHTFNPVFGVTRNPYNLSRSAGGSSGGAAAALAARMAWVADGSDMMGSLRNPAAFCNVYGFRPTWGLVPQDADGDTFLATLSTEGPMARTVADIARLLTVLAGENPEVPFPRAVPDLLSGLDRGVKGIRIGWLADWDGAYPMEPGILGLCESALRQLEALGAVIEPLPAPFPAGKIWSAWVTLRALLNAGGKRDLAEDPARRAQTKPETIWEIEQGLALTAQAVHEASVIRSRWFAHAARLFRRLDAVVLPSAQVWPFPADRRWPDEIAGRRMDTYHRWMEVVVPASLIGLPALSVPVGFGPEGLPMGMQIIGRSGDDAGVLAIGQAWHRATGWPQQRPPTLA